MISLGAGELFVSSDLLYRFVEAAGGECGERDGIEVLGFVLSAETKANGGIGAVLADTTPQSEELFRSHQYTGPIEEVLRESGTPQDRRRTDS